WAFYVHKTLTLRAGGDWRFAALDSDSLGGRMRNEGGIYGTAEWQLAAFFMLIPSVKAAFCSDGSVPATAVPKLGLVFNVNENLTLKNNYFRSFKFPDFEDLYYGESGSYAGNPDLKPEDGWGADAGAAWRVKSLSLEASAFWQWTADSIHWSAGADSIWRPYNVGEAAFAGADARISFDLPHPRFLTGLRPAFSYQFMRSWLLSYGYSWKSDKRIPYQAEHTAGASLEARWRGGRTGLSAGSLLASAHFESRRFADTANLSKLPAYLLVNITLNQHISKNMAVFAAVRNITNTHYQSFKDYPMPGFNFTLGLRVKTEAQSLSNTNKEALYG
ncbi:MAG: TonB-dependent receptor, partial [Spirochaetaceae bacterium]|nr:TonB-dependent receptor [Spirochaetaceae bacterium]